IPVVDERSVSNVEVVNLLLNVFVCACKLSHKNHQSQGALFVNLRFQEASQSFQRRILKLRCEFAQRRHLDADENVAFAVLTCTSLEKPLKNLGGFFVSELLKTLFDFGQEHHLEEFLNWTNPASQVRNPKS